MITYLEQKHKSLSYRILSGFIAFTFIFSLVLPPGYAQLVPASPAGGPQALNLPAPGAMVPLSAGFTPPIIKGVTIDPVNPFEFNFIIGTGDNHLQGEEFRQESRKMIKYFLAALTVPEKELWVNLSPYEKNRMIPQTFGETEMGKDLLAQDYILKQLTASLMYPEEELGKKFWDKVYQQAKEKYGTTEIPMNTFNKVWIVPEKAVVYQHGNSAFVIKSHLKVMLEEDYEAMSHQSSDVSHQKENQNLTTEDRRLTTQIIREVIIPAIEAEVNEGKTFANLRQIYNSVILAAWYKQNLRQTLLGQIYVDQGKTAGVDLKDKTVNEKIYNQYLEAFKKGVYNYIKEDTDPATQEVIPRKYFSGGMELELLNGTNVSASPVLEIVNTLSREEKGFFPVLIGAENLAVQTQLAKYMNETEATVQAYEASQSFSAQPAAVAVASSPILNLELRILELKAAVVEEILYSRQYTVAKGKELRASLEVLKGEKAAKMEEIRHTWISGKEAPKLKVLGLELVALQLEKELNQAIIDTGGVNTNLEIREARDSLRKLEEKIRAKKSEIGGEKNRAGSAASPVVKTGLSEAIGVAAQRITPAAKANTAELNIDAAIRAGANGALAGHSEARANLGDTDEMVNEQLRAAHERNLDHILFAFGEKLEVRGKGTEKEFVKTQIEKGLAGLTADQVAKTIFAYEPIWAIGTGKTATPQQAQEMARFVRDTVASLYSKEVADKIIILYGGSVTPETAAELIAQEDIDGFLVGGASNEYDSFTSIIKTVETHGPTNGRIPYVGGNHKTKKIKTGYYSDLSRFFKTLDTSRIHVSVLPSVGLITEAAQAMASSPVTGDEHPPVYYFGIYDSSINSELPRGDITMKPLLGGKGAGLADMANKLSLMAGGFEAWLRDAKRLSPEKIAKYKLRVPLGYTVTTEQTRHWKERRDSGEEGISDELHQVMMEAMARLETASGKRLGDTEGMPLLVAVRSGAKESMPGMMDTVLNLGLNDRSVEALANASSERFAWDTYRRFVEMYGSIVLGVENDEEAHTGFAAILEHMIKERGVADEYGLGTQDYKKLVGLYKAEIQRQGKEPIPDNPYQQYFNAVETVMRSTFNERAMVYRASQKLKLEDTLSAVNVVEMIYGNRNSKSGTGVAFTRDTATGEKKFNLEFAFEAQGEDVVKGRKKGMFFEDMQAQAPDVAENIRLIGEFLEKTYGDIQDMEFTFEHDENTNTTNVYMLQTRNAKRTSQAEVRVAVEMAEEGLITKETAVKRVNAEKLGELLASRFNPEEKKRALETGTLLSDGGLNASPGAGVGVIALNADKAKAEDQRIKDIQERIKRGASVSDQERMIAKVGGVVLVREETSPDDLGGMVVSKAIATSRGGRTSHAAVVARQFGIPAVVGDKNMVIDFTRKTVTFTRSDGSQVILKEGDIISIDGSGEKGKGQIFKGEIGTKPSVIITAQNIESLDKVRAVIALLQQWMKNLIGEHAEVLRAEYAQHIQDYLNYINEYQDKRLTTEEAVFYQQYKKLLGWASQLRKDKKGLGVGANAERPLDVLNAVLNGAERFGLVRTEHMFSGAGRELKFQRMILAESTQARQAALNQLLPQQQADFEQIFLFADGRPVTIRLIDPPLHEFLPKEAAKIQELADSLGISVAEVQRKIDALKEENPMFGTRGVRLSILFPEIIEMQVNAIFNAMKKVKTANIAVEPEIMVPLVGNVREFDFAKSRIERIARQQKIPRTDFKIGTMIEIIAAGINAAEIAREAEFFSFGTNDFTQGGIKISRDDGKEFLENAKQAGVFTDDPFVTLDSGVALFIKRTVEAARAVNQDIKIGICGEQGVDPTSISKYLAPFGLNYVSGGSLRLPGALVAAAQEALKGHPPLEGKIRKEVPVQKRLYERVPGIAAAQTFNDQLAAAVLYVESNGNTIEARKTALSNLDLAKEAGAELAGNPDFVKVVSWASELLKDNHLDKMGVKVKVGADVNLDQELIPYNSLGMMTTEEYFNGENPIQHSIQAYLLAKDDARKSQLLSEIKEAIQRNFLENSGDEASTRRTFTVRLPNVAFQEVFHYENEAAFNVAVARLSNILQISEIEVHARIAKYHELNPAIGQRGSRVFFTEAAPLYTTIIAAIVHAVAQKDYHSLNFILPFVVNRKEIEAIRSGYTDNRGKVVVPSIDQVTKDARETITIHIGAEIETPAAAATAADIAKAVDGGPVVIDSKRLTEAVWAAFESDVRGAFLQTYMKEGIWEQDPYKITPADTRLLIQEAIGDIKARAWNQVIDLVVNPHDVKLIAMAQQAGVNNLVVDRADVHLATIAAAQAAITIPVLAENGPADQTIKTDSGEPKSSSPMLSDNERNQLRAGTYETHHLPYLENRRDQIDQIIEEIKAELSEKYDDSGEVSAPGLSEELKIADQDFQLLDQEISRLERKAEDQVTKANSAGNTFSPVIKFDVKLAVRQHEELGKDPNGTAWGETPLDLSDPTTKENIVRLLEWTGMSSEDIASYTSTDQGIKIVSAVDPAGKRVLPIINLGGRKFVSLNPSVDYERYFSHYFMLLLANGRAPDGLILNSQEDILSIPVQTIKSYPNADQGVNLEINLRKTKKSSSPLGAIVEKETVSPVKPPVAEPFQKGGIDLNPLLMDLQVKRDGNGMPLPLPLQPVENMHIDGFVPVIINITPVPNLPMLLGLADIPAEDSAAGVNSNQGLSPVDRKSTLKAREPEFMSALN